MKWVCQRDQLTRNEIHSGELQYIGDVAMFRDKHNPNRRVGDALPILLF